MRLICVLAGVVSVSHAAEVPTGLESETGPWPWGSTRGVSKDAFIDRLVRRLTVPELAQHLNLFKYSEIADKNGNATNFANMVGDRGIGEINFWTPKDSDEYNKVQKLAINSARVPIPLIMGGECLHGSFRQNATVFPTNLDLASTWNLELVQETARAIGVETRAVGQASCYGPVVDLAKDARWGRNGENFGEDKFLTARMGVAYIRGLQNEGDLSDFSAVASSVKHFIAHGVPSGGRNIAPALVGRRQLHTEYGLPFRDAIQLANARGLMAAYNSNDFAASMDDPDIYSALREWGFDGRIISDDHDIYRGFAWQGIADTPEQTIADWLHVGGSVNYADWPNDQWVSYIEAAVDSGLVSKDILYARVKDVLSMKYDAGLFDRPYLPANFSRNKTDTVQAQSLAIEGAQQSIVLLKNEDGILPLSNTSIKIALVGPFVETFSLGGYAKYGILERQSTLRQGVLSHMDNSSVVSSWGASDWLDFRAQVIPSYFFSPNVTNYNGSSHNPGSSLFFPSSSENGLFATYYYDTNFENVAYQTIQAPLLEYNTYPPNAPDGSHILQNMSFSVRFEGTFTSPGTVTGAIGAMVNAGSAAVYVDEKLVINSTSSVVSSYCDGPQNFWEHYEVNSTSIPPGLVQFDFTRGTEYKIRIDFISSSGGVVAPAWQLVQRPIEGQSTTDAGVSHAVATAEDADVIVLAVGSSPPSDQETCDVSTTALTPNQTALADAIFDIGKPVVLVTYGPRPKGLFEYYTKSAAVLRTGYAGQAAGHAVANVLFGDVNPSGRLPLTVPMSEGTIPAFYNHQNSDYHYRYSDLTMRNVNGDLLPEGVYGNTNAYNPIYPFGYGLSYTSFSYSPLEFASKSANATFNSRDTLHFSFSVANNGTRKGRAVPQLYLLWRSASVAQPVKQLYGFSNVELEPGESKSVTIDVDVARYLSGFDIKYRWVVEGLTFTFALMEHSGDVTTNNVTLVLDEATSVPVNLS